VMCITMDREAVAYTEVEMSTSERMIPMSQRYNGEEKIGDIVSEFPGASNLFKEAKIDFCCGGEFRLADVIRQKKLDEADLLRRLNEGYAEMIAKGSRADTDYREIPAADLIDHIVNAHHVFLRKELPVLSEFVTKILRVHGINHGELFTLHKRFHEMKLELDQHLITEEEVLFPKLKQYANQPSPELYEKIVKDLHVLEADHSLVGDCLKEMREVTDGYTLPPEACRTYTLTYQKLIELESDIFQHIHLENNILFPQMEEQRV
jgi:regulator of cell morphogenesis and NO signaling